MNSRQPSTSVTVPSPIGWTGRPNSESRSIIVETTNAGLIPAVGTLDPAARYFTALASLLKKPQ